MNSSRCIYCDNEIMPNPRIKRQMYCRDKACQKARRACWQREKMRKDRDYRENQERCRKEWQKRNPGYYKEYRQRHPEYVLRNNLQQSVRNAKRGKDKTSRVIAKMDSLGRSNVRRAQGFYRLVPRDKELIAKMDSLIVKLIPCKGLNMSKSGFN